MDPQVHERRMLEMRIVAALLLTLVMMALERWLPVELPLVVVLGMFAVPYLVAGYDVLREAGEALVRGRALNEDVLMSIATLGVFAMPFLPGGARLFDEAVFVMMFFQVGELFEHIAAGRTRREITNLMAIKPETAHKLEAAESAESTEAAGAIAHQQLTDVAPGTLAVGDLIVIRPGERIPVDGVVVEGSSSLETVALTGESIPRDVTVRDQVISGCVNINGVLTVRVTKEYAQSTAARMLELVEESQDKKARSERFISKFARIYTPVVVAAAVVIALVPPLFSGNFMGTFSGWLIRALTFLIVSCPCALVMSVPLAFFGGVGAASTHGILIKGSNFIDTLTQVKRVVFDKTGTLTHGSFEVRAVHPETIDERELLHLAAHVERHSTHPIAAALRQAYPQTDDSCKVSSWEELAGMGIIAQIDGQAIAVGNERLMNKVGATGHDCHVMGTIVHVAQNSTYLGHIVISDVVKEASAPAIKRLRERGIQVTMLTGDRTPLAAQVATQLGIDDVRSELLPAQKVEAVEELLAQKARPQDALAYVGDGINDAAVLARADVGLAMGALGSDAAIEAADVVLMDDKPTLILDALDIAQRTKRIAHQNIVFSVGVKVGILLLAAVGAAPLWLAIFGDVGVMVLAVANACRTFGSPLAIMKALARENTPYETALMAHSSHNHGCGCGCGCDDDDDDDCGCGCGGHGECSCGGNGECGGSCECGCH